MPPRKRTSKSAAALEAPGPLPVLQPDAAGIDVGAHELYVAVPPDRDPQPVQCFSTFTEGLQALAQWLQQCRIRTVALESTGVYWIPLFQVLERHGFEVCLVNARHLQNVKGRKTDVVDCQWLQRLHAAGLLSASFRPPDAVCALRAILRHRTDLVAQAAQQVQRMQKALTQMNLHLHHVLTDLTGTSGQRILTAILAGERDPEQLAELRERGVKATQEQVVAALQGDWRPEHLFVLRQGWGLYQSYQALLRECDAEIERLLTAFEPPTGPPQAPPPPRTPKQSARKNEIALPKQDLRTELYRLYGTDLTQIPGLGASSVLKLFGELGTDLSRFPTDGHFCSWMALCPDPRKSGGRVLRRQTRQIPHRVATIFRLAAQSLYRSTTPLGRYFARLRTKLGTPAAITALAHKLARLYYHLVRTKEAYDEQVLARQEEAHQQRRFAHLLRDARRQGFELVPLPEAGVS